MFMAFARRCMETELHFVDAVGEAEDGVEGALNSGDDLLARALILQTLIEGGHWNEMSELLSSDEVFKPDSFVELVVERDLVEGLLEVPAEQFVVDERLLGQEMQVLLQRLANEVVLQIREEALLIGLAAQEGHHAPADTNDGEMRLRLAVVLAGPVKDVLHLRQVSFVDVALLCVARNVYTVDASKFLFELLLV